MWNKKREDEPLRPSYTPPAPPANPVSVQKPAEVRKETTVSSMPPARFEAEPRGGAATLGKAVKVVGQIFSREDLYVDVRTARIIIEDGAYFKGSIDIVKPEPAKGAPRVQASAPAPPAAPPVNAPVAASAPEVKR